MAKTKSKEKAKKKAKSTPKKKPAKKKTQSAQPPKQATTTKELLGIGPTAESGLTPTLLSGQAVEVLAEMTLAFGKKSVAEFFDEVFDLWFLKPFLLDYINPEQLSKAETYEDYCALAIAFFRVAQGVPGYSLKTPYGPFVVYVPGTAEVKIAV